MLKILHYRNKCLGCAYCVEVAPALFEVNATDGKVDLIGAREKNGVQSADVNEVFISEAEEAVTVCPAKIIEVRK